MERDSVSRSASECEEVTANFEAAVLAKRLRVANPRSAGESAEGAMQPRWGRKLFWMSLPRWSAAKADNLGLKNGILLGLLAR